MSCFLGPIPDISISTALNSKKYPSFDRSMIYPNLDNDLEVTLHFKEYTCINNALKINEVIVFITT